MIVRDAGQREIALAFLGPADLAFDRVAGAQAEAADDRRRDIDVVRTGEVIGLGRAQEAEAVVQHLDGARTHDLDAVFGLDLQDREHQVLLAHRRRAFDPHLLGHRDEVGGGLFLQFFQMHRIVFSWEDVLELSEIDESGRGRTPHAGRTDAGGK